MKILTLAINKQEFKTTFLNDIFPKKNSVELSRSVRRLRDKGYLAPLQENTRTYYISFYKNDLMREIIRSLDNEGFLPLKKEI